MGCRLPPPGQTGGSHGSTFVPSVIHDDALNPGLFPPVVCNQAARVALAGNVVNCRSGTSSRVHPCISLPTALGGVVARLDLLFGQPTSDCVTDKTAAIPRPVGGIVAFEFGRLPTCRTANLDAPASDSESPGSPGPAYSEECAGSTRDAVPTAGTDYPYHSEEGPAHQFRSSRRGPDFTLSCRHGIWHNYFDSKSRPSCRCSDDNSINDRRPHASRSRETRRSGGGNLFGAHRDVVAGGVWLCVSGPWIFYAADALEFEQPVLDVQRSEQRCFNFVVSDGGPEDSSARLAITELDDAAAKQQGQYPVTGRHGR